MPADDMTCLALWEELPPDLKICDSIIFDPGGGRWYPDPYGIDPIIVVDEGGIPYPPTLVRDGYHFVCWFPPIPNYCPVEEIICVAQWERIPVGFQITFDANGGIGSEVQTVGEGVVPTAPIVTREGYGFLGWDAVIIAAENDATYTAQWEELLGFDPVICFDSNGGTPIGPIVVHPGELMISPPDPTREGYCFLGWEPPLPATMPDYDMCFVAQWEPYTSTITFDSNGGSAVAPITQEEGTEVIPPEDPVKTGFDFMGWMPAVPSTMPADDVTCVALWKISTCTPEIIFNSDGGSYIPTITGNFGDPIFPPATPTKRGYTFGGWSPALPATLPACGITLTAIWILNKYNAYFIVDESVYATIPTNYGAQIATPAPPVKAGYAFLGWAPTVGVMSDADKTFTALFTINTYDAIFMVDGQLYQTIPTLYGAQITLPADPVKAGCIFAGWSPAVPATMPGDDVTCVAQWRLLGDLDNNGSITSVDALIALQGSTGEYLLSALQRLAADANHDGRISSMDALMLLRAASGLITL